MKTRIEILDRLLGTLKPEERSCRPAGTVALIRGAPGSGKTTLSMQILAEHLLESAECAGLLVSLESEPEDVVCSMVNKLSQRHQSVLTLLGHRGESAGVPPGRLVMMNRADLEKSLCTGNWKEVEQALSKDLRSRMAHLHDKQRVLVVLDSMNVLASLAQTQMQPKDSCLDVRFILHRIWTLLCHDSLDAQSPARDVTLLVTDEYHPRTASGDDSLVAESFSCDVIIMLSPEAIAGQSSLQSALISSLGYTIERRLSDEPFSPAPQCVEIRPFCRVIKSRFSANQSRRCAYDIVPGRGMVFAETFAGDGSILMFEENEKQRAVWEEFITRDIPMQFPALRYTLFDRPGLQRTFAVQRRHREFPRKIDAYVACFDTYWVNWFWQLCQRTAIRDTLLRTLVQPNGGASEAGNRESALLSSRPLLNEDHLERNPEERKKWAEWLSQLDDTMTRALELGNDSAFNGATQSLTSSLSPHLVDVTKTEDLLRTILHDVQGGLIGFLQVLPKSRLRLFGECNSDIIKELESPRNMPTEPTHRPRYRRETSDTSQFVSVPYNANVSFLVSRMDLLVRKLAGPRATYLTKLREICLEQQQAFEAASVQLGVSPAMSRTDYTARLDSWIEAKYGPSRHRDARSIKHAPTTWEELAALCELSPQHHFILETQTFDSFLCAFLEVFWGCGVQLRITPQYQFRDRDNVRQALFRSFFLFGQLFERGILEMNATLASEEFCTRFPRRGRGTSTRRRDWLFARHWHSTLVDNLTARCGRGGKHRWQPPARVQLETTPLPYMLSAAIHLDKPELDRVSCWGEWHLAALAGGENEALTIELINNLMSSHKICERATSCAALPTVEEFYVRYGEAPCFNLPEREDVDLPRITFNDLRKQVFTLAQSRNEIFDYRHCMREVHAALTCIQRRPSQMKERLIELVESVITRIEAHREHDMMIH